MNLIKKLYPFVLISVAVATNSHASTTVDQQCLRKMKQLEEAHLESSLTYRTLRNALLDFEYALKKKIGRRLLSVIYNDEPFEELSPAILKEAKRFKRKNLKLTAEPFSEGWYCTIKVCNKQNQCISAELPSELSFEEQLAEEPMVPAWTEFLDENFPDACRDMPESDEF